jgi:hypothetical protein
MRTKYQTKKIRGEITLIDLRVNLKKKTKHFTKEIKIKTQN